MSGKTQGRTRTVAWSGRFIVKIQLSEYTTANTRQILVYNEDRSVYWQDDAGMEIIQTMRGRPRVFFEAIRDSFGVIHIGDEAEDQDW